MKKFLFICIGLIISACTEKDVDFENIHSNLKDGNAIFIEETGRIHNDALEFVYKEFKTLSVKGMLDSVNIEELVNLAQLYSVDYLEKSDEPIFDIEDRGFSIEMLNVMFADKRVHDTKPSNLRILSSTDSFNQKQIDLFDQMEKALDDDNLSLEGTIDIFMKVKDEAYRTLPRSEAIIIIGAVDVGINSMKYWHDNIDDWGKLVNEPTRWFNWREVAAWDIAGAAGGAAAAAVTGAGIGVGIIGGAVGTSVCNAVYQVVAHAWDL